jgi:hypothetical protein
MASYTDWRLEFAHGGDYLSKHETEHLESA